MKKGVFLAIIYGIVLITAFYFRDFLLHWLHESDVSHLPFMFFLSILFGLIPMIPFTVFAGTMGAKYGILLGSIINWFGSVGAVVIIFVLVRYLSVNNLQQYANRFKRLNKFNEMIARNAFFSVFIARIIHIIPPMVVHIYSVLSSMSFKTFFSCHRHWLHSFNVRLCLPRKSIVYFCSNVCAWSCDLLRIYSCCSFVLPMVVEGKEKGGHKVEDTT